MNRYAQTFKALKKKREGALVPFVVLGDPDYSTSKKILEKLCSQADILELGFPFSDPIADGKRIQAADERALRAGTSVEKCFDLIKHARKINRKIPIGLLLYYNLVFSNGAEKFLKKAKQAGVDGILIADMPLEESGSIRKSCHKIGLQEIFIVAPTTRGKRMEQILSRSKGFVYIVGVLGVTGERREIESETIALVKKVKRSSKIPACIGFGISSPDHVKAFVSAGADGVIVGSALEGVIEKNLKNKEKLVREVEKFIVKMKGATRKDARNKKSR